MVRRGARAEAAAGEATGVRSAIRLRGQHAGLTADAIVRTAIALADDEGLASVSMRRIGAELEVEAMALYHHFANKASLLDAVVEEIATSEPAVEFTESSWRDGLRRYARAQLDSLSEHPNLIELVMSRPAVTSGNLDLLERLVDFLCDAGFPARRALDMVYVVNELVLMHAALDVGFGRSEAPHGEKGQDDRLAGASAEAFPRLAEAARAGHDRSPTARFEFALDALITGFAEVDR